MGCEGAAANLGKPRRFYKFAQYQTAVDWEAHALNSSPVSVILLLCDLKLMTVPPRPHIRLSQYCQSQFTSRKLGKMGLHERGETFQSCRVPEFQMPMAVPIA